MAAPQGPKPPVHFTISRSSGGPPAVRLTSPTGRTLVISKQTLEDLLYTAMWLLAQHDGATMSRPMVEALTCLGTIETPPASEGADARTD